ncbi:GntR family transcriptional regulator [Thermomonospora echinospora]|uniref:GntR family transcriptional regulator n=1 Tax=Thermomonospora echinospora TaxID=1992 RepID=A0A1H6E864_9ACTN|nr:GntR family transcriptional regulator [Thermomonospora echinospora]SEG93134.1 GntR family transcriptional regulator [Thermomonospora echinospora]
MSKPSYRDIAAILRREIEAGDYERGSLFPPEPALAERFNTTRATINNVLRVLRAEGLVSTQQGRGTTVTAMTPRINRDAVSRYRKDSRERARGAFDSEVRKLGMEPRSDLTVGRVVPPAEVAAILNIEPGQEVVVRSRRMYADGVPVQIAPSYIPLDIAAGTVLEEQNQGQGGMVSRMADLGYRQVRMTESITVRPPNDDEADFLQMSADQRVYVITHVGWTADNRPVEVCVHVMPTHYWTLEYGWDVDPAE